MRTKTFTAVAIAVLVLAGAAVVTSCCDGPGTGTSTIDRSDGDQAENRAGDPGQSGAGGDGDSVEGAETDACQEVYAALTTVASDVLVLVSPTVTQADRDKFERDLETLKARAPKEISPDIDRWAVAFAEWAQSFQTRSANQGNLDANSIDRATQQLDTPGFREATQKINAYMGSACSKP